MFLTRTISGIVLVILAFGAIWAGDWVLLLTIYAVSLVGFFELTRAMGVNEKRKAPNAYEVVGVIGITCYDALMYVYGSGLGLLSAGEGTQLTITGAAAAALACLMVMILTLLCLMAVYVIKFPKTTCDVPIRTFFACIYAPVMLSFIWLIREWYGGFYLVWLVFISSWISDTCAYLVGRTFGRHKLAPVLSPKKSVEGSVGGILGAALVGFLYGWILQTTNTLNIPHQALSFALIGGVGSVLSQLGDLAASGIKRDHDIKDYGKLIPGHGGIMDRFDSVIVTAPLIYFLGILLFS
ncbi:MAG: phosphatidate cytidylyltransferase [Clostridium sp.]|nr:phosphatidate cytidylyltransferase [Clostridium sp.]